jgi:cytochrome bd-type quinol oxidase subunit 2
LLPALSEIDALDVLTPIFAFLVPPDILIMQAAAPLSVLRPVPCGTAIGLLVLGPSFLYLFRVFKGGAAIQSHG